MLRSFRRWSRPSLDLPVASNAMRRLRRTFRRLLKSHSKNLFSRRRLAALQRSHGRAVPRPRLEIDRRANHTFRRSRTPTNHRRTTGTRKRLVAHPARAFALKQTNKQTHNTPIRSASLQQTITDAARHLFCGRRSRGGVRPGVGARLRSPRTRAPSAGSSSPPRRSRSTARRPTTASSPRRSSSR